jgi:uncharacterized protein YcbK (DUF882 family)
MDAETIRIADEVREFVGKPVTPSSGCRCLEYNRRVGSDDTSQHVKARAIDLPVDNPREVYDWLCERYQDVYGLGVYKTFVHIDTRTNGPARWDNT